MEELGSVLTNNVSAIVTTAIFIWYLIRKDKSHSDALDKFNSTINNHLSQVSQQTAENISSRVKLAGVLENLVRIVNELYSKIK